MKQSILIACGSVKLAGICGQIDETHLKAQKWSLDTDLQIDQPTGSLNQGDGAGSSFVEFGKNMKKHTTASTS